MNIELQDEQRALVAQKRDLTLKKMEIESKLIAIKNLIRTSGRMERGKYRTTTDAQTQYSLDITEIHRKLSAIKTRLSEIWIIEHQASPRVGTKPDSEAVKELCELRQRLESMRTMASEFVLGLDTIISAINRGEI